MERCTVKALLILHFKTNALIRREYVLLRPEHVLPEFLLQFKYTCAEKEGTPSQQLSVSSSQQPEDGPRENFNNKTVVPCPLAFTVNNCNSLHGRGSDNNGIERRKADSRNTGQPFKNSKFLNHDNIGVFAEIMVEENTHTKNGGEPCNMAASTMISKQNIIYRIKNARVDYITRRNESLKRECAPFFQPRGTDSATTF